MVAAQDPVTLTTCSNAQLVPALLATVSIKAVRKAPLVLHWSQPYCCDQYGSDQYVHTSSRAHVISSLSIRVRAANADSSAYRTEMLAVICSPSCLHGTKEPRHCETPLAYMSVTESLHLTLSGTSVPTECTHCRTCTISLVFEAPSRRRFPATMSARSECTLRVVFVAPCMPEQQK